MLVAPEPDRQTPHAFDEVYVVVDGRGAIDVEGESIARVRDPAGNVLGLLADV